MSTRPWSSAAGPDARFLVVGQYNEMSSACMPCTVTLDATFLNRDDKPAEEGVFFVVITDGGTTAQTPVFKGPPTLVLP